MFIARYHYDSKGNKIQFETRQQYENRLRELGFDDETIARYSYNRYNGKSDYEANSKEALENRLLDMYLAVITNANTFNEVRQPLDAVTDYLKDHILSVVDSLTQQSKASTSSPLYYVTPQFQSKTKAELSGGKRGIGPFALAASHHALTQQVGLTLANNKGSEILQRFGITNVSGIRSNQNNHAPGFEQVNTNILDWLSAMTSAHVDVAKDPYIIRLNVRSLTYNMTNFLLRTGVGETTFYFLPQQILKDFAVEYDKYAGFYGVDLPAYANPESTAHRNVWNKYFEAANKLATTPSQKKKLDDLKKNPSAFLSSELLDIDWLMKQLNVKDEAYKSFNWYFNQLRIMKLYDAFTPASRSLSALTTLSQIDTKKFGNNFGLESAFLVRWKNFIQTDSTFNNPLSMFTNTFLYQKLVNGMLFPRDAFKNVMLRLTPQFEIWRNKLHALTGTLGSSNNDTINSITRAMEAQYKSAFFDKYCKDHNINVDELLYGKNSIVNRFYTLRNRIVRGEYPTLLDSTGRLENALLNSLVPRQKYDALDAILPDFFELKFNKDGNDGMDDILIRAWEELSDSEYADVREFARDLAIYSFYTSGDAFGRNNFFKYVPNSLRESLGYFDYIRNLESDPDNLSQFAQLTNPIFRNLWWNEDIVPTVEYVKPSMEFDKATGEVYHTDGKLPNQESGYTIQTDDGKYLDVPGIFMNTRRPRTIGFNEQGDTIYTPYVKIRLNGDLDPRYTMLYRFIGVAKDSQGNVEYPVYRLIPKFGVNMQGMTLLEFGKQTSSIGANNYYYKGSVDPTIFTDYRPIKDIAPTSLKTQVDVFNFLKDINTNPQQLASEQESSRTTQQNSIKQIEISSEGYRKGLPQENPDIDYVFTENAEAYVASNKVILDVIPDFPNQGKTKLGVSDMNGTNQAGIRNTQFGTITVNGRQVENPKAYDPAYNNPNAYGIVVKKYQQDANGRFVAAEGQFQDTEEDFKLFVSLNEDMFQRLSESKNTKIVFPTQMGLGKAALPIRFAEWLQFELKLRFNIDSEILENTKRNYEGYGLSIPEQEQTIGYRSEESENTAQPETTPADPTQEFAEEWSKKEGWSVNHFYSEVLPKIDKAWQIEFELAPDQSVKADYTGRMDMDYNGDTREGIQSTSTIEAIKRGERTATTRYERADKPEYIDYWKQAKVGDVIEWKRGDESVKVIVTKPLTKLTEQITPQTETVTTGQPQQATPLFTWARYSDNNYEVSGAEDGDRRFSAFYAQLNDGRYIEDIYQLDIKGNGTAQPKPLTDRQNPTRSDVKKTGAFTRQVSREQSWEEYKALWRQYLDENPELERDLLEKAYGKVLTDQYASTEVSQARALAELLNERHANKSTLQQTENQTQSQHIAPIIPNDLRQVRINVPGTDVPVTRLLAEIESLRDAENIAINNNEPIDSIINYGVLEDWHEVKRVSDLLSNQQISRDINDILSIYEKENKGTDFSELSDSMRLSEILTNILVNSGAYVREDPNQLSLFSETESQLTKDFDEFVRETSDFSNTQVLEQVRSEIPQAAKLASDKKEAGYTFTFKNGFEISLPFKLNEQQVAALYELEAFVNDPASSQFTLSGYAGTGKTTVIGIFKQYLDNIHQKVVFTAPTHRANAVTKTKTPGATVMTLAKLFGLSVDVDLSSNNYDLRTLKARQTNDPKLEGDELIIIDEASMVQDGMYELIQNQLATYPGTKVIYVGDQGQLRPVKSDKISKVFTDADTPKMQLTKVERTGDNPILKESTRLRNGEGFSYETELVNGEGVTFTNDRTQIATWVKNALQSSNFSANKTYFKIVAGTNAAVEAWNKYARKVLFGTTEHYLTEGDLITGYNNALRDRFGEYQFINSMDYVVTAIKPTSLKYSLDGETVTLQALDVTLQNAFDSSVDPIRMSFAVPGQTQILTKMREYIDDMWSVYRAAKAKGDRQSARLALQKINTITNNLFLLENVKDSNGRLLFQKTADYGYAVTAHKSQSGTFNKVLVDEKSIHAFRNAELEKELKYVAVSRASEDVMVIADKTNIENPITNKPMSNDFSSADQMASDEANALRGIQPNAEASARFQQSLANLGLTEEEINELSNLGTQRKKECE